MKIVDFVRKDFAETGGSPGLRRISGNTGVDIRTIYTLFPHAPGKTIAHIAGTPKPKSCL